MACALQPTTPWSMQLPQAFLFLFLKRNPLIVWNMRLANVVCVYRFEGPLVKQNNNQHMIDLLK